jgi:hypothetical protein
MLLRSATRNCGRNISPLFKIAAAKFQDAKFKVLPHSGSGNGPLPLLRVQLRPLPPLFITLETNYLSSILFDWEPTMFVARNYPSPATGLWNALLLSSLPMVRERQLHVVLPLIPERAEAAQPHFHRYMGFTLIVWTLSMTCTKHA